MSSFIGLQCNCSPECDAVAIVDEVHTDTEARVVLHRRGWDCDTVGGNTFDTAPGHVLDGTAPRTPMVAESRKDWGVAWFGHNAQNGVCHRCQRASRVYQGYNGGAHMGLFCSSCKDPVLRGAA